MTVSDLLQQIRINLDKKRLEIAESLVDGRVSDFSSYQKNVGIASGQSATTRYPNRVKTIYSG